MELDDVAANFRKLAKDMLTKDFVRKEQLGIIAAEQIRAGFFSDAEETLELAIRKEVEEIKREIEDGIAEFIADEVEETGQAACMPPLRIDIGEHKSFLDEWKLLWLAIGYANAGKLAEAQAYAESMRKDDFRAAAIRFVREEAGLGPEERRARDEKRIRRKEVVSMFKAAAALAEHGKDDDACEIARAAICRLETRGRASIIEDAGAYGKYANEFFIARAYVNGECTNLVFLIACELANNAIRLRAERGERMPADFAKKTAACAQAAEAKKAR